MILDIRPACPNGVSLTPCCGSGLATGTRLDLAVSAVVICAAVRGRVVFDGAVADISATPGALPLDDFLQSYRSEMLDIDSCYMQHTTFA